MLQKEIYIKKLNSHAVIPTYGTEYAAGADLYACLEAAITLAPAEMQLIPTGIALEIPEGYVGLVYARSGLATKKGLAPANKVGVIDSDYRGELFVPLYNHSQVPQTVENGERIAQLIITPYVQGIFQETNELNDTSRSDKGFGSTGKF